LRFCSGTCGFACGRKRGPADKRIESLRQVGAQRGSALVAPGRMWCCQYPAAVLRCNRARGRAGQGCGGVPPFQNCSRLRNTAHAGWVLAKPVGSIQGPSLFCPPLVKPAAHCIAPKGGGWCCGAKYLCGVAGRIRPALPRCSLVAGWLPLPQTGWRKTWRVQKHPNKTPRRPPQGVGGDTRL